MSYSHCEECQDGLPGLLEGDLGAAEAERIRAHLEICPDCRREYEWLLGAVADLEFLGDDILRNAPTVDLVDAVLRDADAIDRAAATEPPARPRRRPWAVAGPVLAAAAALVLFAWVLLRERPTTTPPAPPSGPQIARAPEAPPVTPRPVETRPPRRRWETPRASDRAIEIIEAQRLPARRELAATNPPDLEERITVDDIVRERRRAVSDREAWTRLVQWATLSPEDARRIASNPEATPGAIVAAAESLAPDEAELYLLSAIGRHPEDPQLRMALAREQAFTGPPVEAQPGAAETVAPPEDPSKALLPVRDLKELDPENALPYYMEAELLLRNGDVAAALQSLAEAALRSAANPYTLEAAQNREQALIASGMDPESARLLAALTAGTDEYEFLYNLGNDLLEYGRAYVQEGYLDEARSIFEGVHTFGDQVENSASFSREQLAGLELQLDAQTELQSLYQALGAQEALDQLYQQTEALWTGIENISRFFESLNAWVMNEDDLWTFIADTVLQSGDLSLQGMLPSNR